MGSDTRFVRKLVKKADKAKTVAREKKSAYEVAACESERADRAVTLAVKARTKSPADRVFLIKD